jgi:hypothetical protein
MYQSKYKSIFRCHTLYEAINYDLKSISEVDLFLFLLDTYDILLEDANFVDENNETNYLNLIVKLEKFCFLNFNKLLSSNQGVNESRASST